MTLKNFFLKSGNRVTQARSKNTDNIDLWQFA